MSVLAALVGLGDRLVAGLALDVKPPAAVAAHQRGRLERDRARRPPARARSRSSARCCRARSRAKRLASGQQHQARRNEQHPRDEHGQLAARPVRGDADEPVATAASPNRWIAIVYRAKPRPRSSAGRTFAIAALSGPGVEEQQESVTNIAGQKIAGAGRQDGQHREGQRQDAAPKPDRRKWRGGRRPPSRSPSWPPVSVPGEARQPQDAAEREVGALRAAGAARARSRSASSPPSPPIANV